MHYSESLVSQIIIPSNNPGKLLGNPDNLYTYFPLERHIYSHTL